MAALRAGAEHGGRRPPRKGQAGPARSLGQGLASGFRQAQPSHMDMYKVPKFAPRNRFFSVPSSEMVNQYHHRKVFDNGLIVRTFKESDGDILRPMWKSSFLEMVRHFMNNSLLSPQYLVGVGISVALLFVFAGQYAVTVCTAVLVSYGAVCLAGYLYVRSMILALVEEGMQADMTKIQEYWLDTKGTKCGRHFLVAELNGNIVGCVALREDENPSTSPTSGSAWRMVTDSSMRRKGIAKKLMLELEDVAKHFGYDYIRLMTANPDAVKFYNNIGYRTYNRFSPQSSRLIKNSSIFQFEKVLKRD